MEVVILYKRLDRQSPDRGPARRPDDRARSRRAAGGAATLQLRLVITRLGLAGASCTPACKK